MHLAYVLAFGYDSFCFFLSIFFLGYVSVDDRVLMNMEMIESSLFLLQNIDMQATILSRFDMIYVVKDTFSAEQDAVCGKSLKKNQKTAILLYIRSILLVSFHYPPCNRRTLLAMLLDFTRTLALHKWLKPHHHHLNRIVSNVTSTMPEGISTNFSTPSPVSVTRQ